MTRHLISRGTAALFAALLAAGTVAGAPYPTRTVEIVVPYGAGGSTDLTARMLAQKLQDRLGQSFVVINRPGASGSIGVMSVARAEPDGYTLLMSYATETVVVPQMAKPAKYTIDDFEPVAVTGEVPLVLVTSKSIAANTLGELIAAIRRAPGKYTYGGSVGSPSHLSGAWFNRLQHLDVQHIPYKGGAQAMGDVSGGHLDMFYPGLAAAKAAYDAGAVKALAQTGERRSAAFPNVPTFAEAGIADFELSSWTMMLAPKGTPAEIVQVLKQEVARALDNPHMRNVLNEQGIEPPPPLDVRDFLARENEKFGRLVRETGIADTP
jgi:tripartite-type tricarboxylate transporter receptor subunit TctC